MYEFLEICANNNNNIHACFDSNIGNGFLKEPIHEERFLLSNFQSYKQVNMKLKQ